MPHIQKKKKSLYEISVSDKFKMFAIQNCQLLPLKLAVKILLFYFGHMQIAPQWGGGGEGEEGES